MTVPVPACCRLEPTGALTSPSPRLAHPLATARPRPSSQPSVYRNIIDDVVASVRADFDEFGVEEDLLALLQQVRQARAG